ncbi:MAG: aspartate--tRNA ligase [Pseudomonas marincola]
MHSYRTHTCAELRDSDVGKTVRLSGWVHRKRDHGNLLFIDLRDHYGITQCVIETDVDIFPQVEAVRSESVITVTGKVVARAGDAINPNLPTGQVELDISEFELQSAAEDLPMPVFGEQEYPEDIRLRHRYLDLRRERLHNNIILRSKIISALRTSMQDQGFMEFQTPILTASSPEGARDFLVPSRMHPGQFYALPQAPQQFKQLVMMSGFDRYFQIAPCFRDEDARADRSPGEFYQLDIEMAYVTQEDVFQAVEPVLTKVFQDFAGDRVVETPFVRIPFSEAMMKYGSDKPDLRNPIILSDVSEVFRDSGFGLFAKSVASGSVVRAIPAPGAGSKARSFFDKMNEWARKEGAGGLGYIIFKDGEAKGPIAKNLDADRIAQIQEITGVSDGDGIFFACDKELKAAELAGKARNIVGNDLDICEKNVFKFCWVIDFPMFEYDEKEKKLDFSHNPFSMPQGGLEALENMDPLDIKGYQYDIVCNGIELSSGAIRNHRPEIMMKAFEIAGYDASVVEERFGGMLNAFKYGAPPHGGIAPGVDRIVMMLADEPNIREVILFPMNQQAQDLMMQAPAPVPSKNLRELHVRTVMPDPKPQG